MKKLKLIYILLPIVLVIQNCSTEKNTAITRAYHNLTAHYNVYFNGKQALEAGEKKLEKKLQDKYQGILPVFKYSYPEAKTFITSEMNRVLEKGAKTISNHSITVKPKFKNKRKLTPYDKELLKKNEYCKWIDDAYLLIGKANFYKGEYAKSLITFRKIINLYKTENTRFEAQLWLAKTYIAQKKFKDAENTLIELLKDPRHPKKLDPEIFLTCADLYIQTKKYSQAITYLQKAIKLIKKRRKRARYYYILAQIYLLQKNYKQADYYFKKVIKANPSYEMVFNAKIARASAFNNTQDAQQIIKQLKKLLKDEKNEEYEDQIYYAIAQVYLREGDTAQALKNLKLSTINSIDNRSQKALSFLLIADIYFKKKEFLKAGKYYDSTMQYLPKDYPNYNQIAERAQNTGLLVKYLGEVKLQDSLQRVAKMPEKERNKLIQKLIQNAIREQQEQQEQQDNFYNPYDIMNQNTTPVSQGGKWYFYNPMLVSRGQAEFKKKWGNRKLEDNWRRKNKSILETNTDEKNNQQETQNTITDKTKPEYYLQNLPLNDSLMQISNNKIKESLFKAADVYENLFHEPKNAIKLYEELLTRFPDSKYTLETYYRLYKLYQKLNNTEKTQKYRSKIILEYPNSKYAKILLDPSYAQKINQISKKLMKLYDKSLQEYYQKKYSYVIKVSDSVLNKYPESDVAPYFLYLKAMSLGNLGNIDTMQILLDSIIKTYKNAEISQTAKTTLNIIKSGKYDYTIYKYAPETKHAFISIYNKNANSTLLKFNLYTEAQSFSNKTEYKVDIKNFNENYKIISVQWFENAQKAKEFMQQIENKENIFKAANVEEKHDFIISNDNLQQLLKDKNLIKYDLFYQKYYK